MPVATASLKIHQQISNIIKRFKFEELETAVVPSFPEISWNDIRSKLIKQHESFTIKNAARLIEEAISAAELREQDLKDRLSTLEVIDISRHSRKKIWYTYGLKGTALLSNISKARTIQTMIKDTFRTYDKNIDVKVTVHNGITYVLLKDKPKQRRAQRVMPIFFAFFPGQKYFFCSKKNVSKNVIKVITISLGCSNSRRLKLTGRDLNSLMKLIMAKKRGTLTKENMTEEPVYKETDPLVKSTGIDYTQQRQRKNYAEKCFGKDAPTLELLVINGPEQLWRHENVMEKLSNEHMKAGWEFRSRNLATFLTKLTEHRVLISPMPYYMSNLMIIGKNELTLQND